MSRLSPQEQKPILQQPVAQEPVFPLSETLIAAEYSALREEILKRSETQFQLIVVALTAFGTILTVGMQIKSASILFVYPILTLLLSMGWIDHAYSVDMLGSYIHNVIERRVGPRNIGWEHASRSKPPAHAFIAFWFSRWHFTVTQLIALGAGIAVLTITHDFTIITILLALLAIGSTGINIFVFTKASRTQGKGKRLGEITAV